MFNNGLSLHKRQTVYKNANQMSLLTVEGKINECEIEYGEHPNDCVRGLEVMSVNRMVEKCQHEENRE